MYRPRGEKNRDNEIMIMSDVCGVHAYNNIMRIICIDNIYDYVKYECVLVYYIFLLRV